MRLAYVDESYTRERFYLGALLVDDTCAWTLAQDLDAIVHRASEAYPGVPADAELHGYSLFHSKDDWASLTGAIRARVNIYDDALRAIARSGAQFIFCGAAVAPGARMHPSEMHAALLPRLLERIDEYGRWNSESVLVLADEVHEHDRLRAALRDLRRSGNPDRRFRQILDTLHFAPSRDSRFIQAVDLVTFLYCRRQGGLDQDSRAVAANAALWRRVARCRWRIDPLLALLTHEGPARSGAHGV